jgi:hypothetical protein
LALQRSARFQSAIGNRKSPRSFLASLARAGLKRATFALPQLSSGGAALKRMLIRTQSGSPIHRQNALDFSVWPRDDVHANQLAYPAGGRCPGIRCSFNCAYISTHKNRHIPGADILFSKERDVRRFDHGVSRLNGSNKAFGLHHSECF